MMKFVEDESDRNPIMSSTRIQKLQEISTFVVNGRPTYKLDFLGTISIHGRDYFHVLRRYNNVYEFVFEDYRGELHFHKDYTVAQSIQRLLCLSDEQMCNLHVLSVYSMKHNGAPTISDSFLDMRWSAIQGNWYGLMMNLGGILDYESVEDSYPAYDETIQNNTMEEFHVRFDNQDKAIDYCLRTVDELRREFETPVMANPENSVHYPDEPEKALRCIPYRRTEGSNGVKRQRLTDRFAELQKEEEQEEEYQEEEDYLELRSGVKYYK
jgi:hypothetical protein